MISNKSKNILTIGTDTNGKGGIAILIQSYSKMFKKFNFIASHQEGNLFKKTALSISALLRCCYYCIFKPIRIVHIHTASFTDFIVNRFMYFVLKFSEKKSFYIYMEQNLNNSTRITNLLFDLSAIKQMYW